MGRSRFHCGPTVFHLFLQMSDVLDQKAQNSVRNFLLEYECTSYLWAFFHIKLNYIASNSLLQTSTRSHNVFIKLLA